jgi:hypothetical protein
MHLDLLGTRFRVRTNAASLSEPLAHVLADVVGPDGPVPGRRLLSVVHDVDDDGWWRVYQDCHLEAEHDHPAAALDSLVSVANRAAIEETRRFAAHAGVVELAGVALAVPGASGAGKSTLTAALVMAGAGYVSDEALAIDYDDGLVRGYPKPIALGPESRRVLDLRPPGLWTGADGEGTDSLFTAVDLGGVARTEPMVLAVVVVPRRRPGPPELADGAPGQAVSSLLSMSFNHFRRPADAFGLAVQQARRVRWCTLDYDDAVAAAEVVVERFGAAGAWGDPR